jgi:hypothetical protein
MQAFRQRKSIGSRFKCQALAATAPLAANQLAGGGDFKGATAGEPDGYRVGLLQ